MKTICSHCRQSVEIDDRLRGRPVACPSCRQVFEAQPAAGPAGRETLENDRELDELDFPSEEEPFVDESAAESASEEPQSPSFLPEQAGAGDTYQIPEYMASRRTPESAVDNPYMAATGGDAARSNRPPRGSSAARGAEPLWAPLELVALLTLPVLVRVFLAAGALLGGLSVVAALYGLFREGGGIGAALANLLTCLIAGLVLIAAGQTIKVFLSIERRTRDSHQTLQAILQELRRKNSGDSE